jgi:hypothetical protein
MAIRFATLRHLSDLSLGSWVYPWRPVLRLARRTTERPTKFARMMLGESYEMEFPEDGDMMPPSGFNTLLEAFSSIRHHQIMR